LKEIDEGFQQIYANEMKSDIDDKDADLVLSCSGDNNVEVLCTKDEPSIQNTSIDPEAQMKYDDVSDVGITEYPAQKESDKSSVRLDASEPDQEDLEEITNIDDREIKIDEHLQCEEATGNLVHGEKAVESIQELEFDSVSGVRDTCSDQKERNNTPDIMIDEHVQHEDATENSVQEKKVKEPIQELDYESVVQVGDACSDEKESSNIVDIKSYEQEIVKKEIDMQNELESFKQKIEKLENEKVKLKHEIEILKKQDVIEFNKSGKKVIIPTVNLDQEKLDEEILNDTREAELLIQLKHLKERVEVQDTLLAETKEENTVLRIQNQNLLETINKPNAKSKSAKKNSDMPSLDWLDGDDSNEKKRLFLLEQELEDQKEVNKQLKAYVGDVLINIIVQNPQILEKKQ